MSLPFMTDEAIMATIANCASWVASKDPDVGLAVIAFAYEVGPGLDEETLADEDVQVIAQVQLLAMLLACVIAVAQEHGSE